MKIIHILNHFIPDQIGGTEVYVLSLSKACLLQNVETLVLVPNYGKNMDETFFVEGVKVIKYAEPSIANRALIMGKAIPEGLSAFVQVIKAEKPDIVHFHTIGQSIGITIHHLRAVKDAGIRTILTFHISGYSCNAGTLMYKNQTLCNGLIDIKRCTACHYAIKEISPAKQKVLLSIAMLAYKLRYDTTNWQSSLGTAIGFPFVIERLKKTLFSIVEHCDKVVVLTKWYKEVLLLNGIAEDKIVRVTQGLPFQQANTKIAELKKPGLKLVFIGRIIEEKGIHLLIEAITQLAQEKLSLDIFAQPNESKYALQLESQTASQPNIFWKGISEPSVVVNTLSNYDVLCVPSVVCEMSPLVIQEAFAAGIPVLASDVYGNAEQITDDVNGWLFQFGSSMHLKVKLEMLLQKPELIEAAKKSIPEVKSFEAVANEYKIVYDEVWNTG